MNGPVFSRGEDSAQRPTGLIVAVLVVLGAFSIGHVVFGLPMSLVLFGSVGPDTAALPGQMFTNLVPFLGTLLALYCWVRFRERRAFSTLGFLSRPSRSVLGATVAVAMVGAMALVCVLSGQLSAHVRPVSTALIGGVLLALVGFVVQGSTEEVLFRGFLLQVGVRRWGVAAGVGLQAGVFSLLHGVNPGGLAALPMVNLLLFAVFLAMWALLEGGLWIACAWHAVWNWMQGNVLGIQVSGEAVDTSIVRMTPLPGSSDLVTGGAFGLEGGLLTTGVLLVGIVAVAFVQRRTAASRRAPAAAAI